MVTPTAGAVVLVPFPFSDLSQSNPGVIGGSVILARRLEGQWSEERRSVQSSRFIVLPAYERLSLKRVL